MTLGVSSDSSLLALSVSKLAEQCMSEVSIYRRREPFDERYCVELFRRAIRQDDPVAREAVEQCFHETMLHWLRSHPQREAACHLDSEEHYVAQAFARFWQATAKSEEMAFQTLATALRYLRAGLHSALLDTLRAYWRPKEVPFPDPSERGEPFTEDSQEGCVVWEVIQSLLPDEQEQRIAYLLFHCGLTPREIVRSRPEEFREVQEIYRLQLHLMEQLLRHADSLRFRL